MMEAGFTQVSRTISLMLIVVFFCPFACGKVIYVDDDAGADFENIQAGIDAAEYGDTVSVAPGIYYENITMKNGINLSGAGADVTIIDANGYGDVVDARANDVTICGFTLRNSGQFDSGHINCGVYIWGSYTPIIRNNIIVHSNNGIGLWDGANPDIKNNIIKNNFIGIYIYGSEDSPSNPVIINNTIVNNELDGITLRVKVSPVIVNNIIVGHITGINHNYVTGSPTISYNNLWHNDVNYMHDNGVDDTLAGPGSISVDPYFAEPGYWADVNDPNIVVEPNDPNAMWIDEDFHLKSQSGRWEPVAGSWIIDDVTSPCIDGGDPNMTVDNEPIPNGDRINMGAYGGTQEAGRSYILAKIIYVDDDASGANDGSSWADAYKYLQDALADAGSADKPVEIRVAQGIYRPDRNAAEPNGTGDRAATFQLINGATVKGGYAGHDDTDPNARDVEVYETVLSGDLKGDDIDVNDPCDLRNEPTRHENSDRIVNATAIDATTVLDGFTICSAFGPFGSGMDIYQGNPTIVNCTFKGNTAYHDYGGGLLNSSGNPKLLNCMFTGNYAKMGGGMCSIRSSPTLTGCVFTGNYAELGAGLCNMKDIPKGNSTRDSNSTLIDCTFIDNIARFRGGGMVNGESDSTLSNCTFSGNSSLGSGAGMYNRGSKHVMTDCTFSRNTTFDGNGGGIWNDDVNELTLANCTLSNNSSKFYGGGIAGKTNKAMMINCLFVGNKVYGEPGKPYDIGRGGGLASYGDTILANCTFAGNWARNGRAIFNDSSLKLYNCVLWGSDNEIFDPIQDSMAFIAYSNIQNGWEGTDKINEDPLFANPGYWADADDPNIAAEPNDPNAVWVDGDYHLKSQAGRWDPVSESWVQDDVTSPCIDAGDPNSPIGHEPFPNGGIINMGAYGGTEQASLSL